MYVFIVLFEQTNCIVLNSSVLTVISLSLVSLYINGLHVTKKNA